VVDADIRGVLRLVSKVSNLNFVVPDHVQSTVTASLEDVPWDMALAAILSAEGLMAVPYSDEIILIEPIPTTR
jgi:type IV pilus assembly protein PilQ